MGVAHKAITDGSSDRRVGDARMAVCYRQLGRHHGGTLAISIVNDLEPITRLYRSERNAEPVVKDEQTDLGERVKQSRV